MAQTMYVIPKPGLVIRQPDMNMALLPPEGALVIRSLYWHSMINEGSVTEGRAPAAEDPNKPAKAERKAPRADRE